MKKVYLIQQSGDGNYQRVSGLYCTKLCIECRIETCNNIKIDDNLQLENLNLNNDDESAEIIGTIGNVMV